MSDAALLAAPFLVSPVLAPERAADAAVVEALIERAFGPGRYAKTAERLREGRRPAMAMSFVAWVDGRAVGCVRQWPILVGETRALLLGPIAVEADRRREGLGAALVQRACAAAQAAGWPVIVLVGDTLFFGPLGFSAEAARDAILPGPVDPRRLLALPLAAGVVLSGKVRPLPA